MLFYAFRDDGFLMFNSQFTIFSVLAIFVFLFLFKKINFTKATNWKLVLYSLFVSIFLCCLTLRIRLIIIDGFHFERVVNFVSALYFVLATIIATVYLGIKRGILFILFASIVTFIGFYKEKYDRNKKNETNNQINE